MNFETSEITLHISQTARDFAQQKIKPHVMEWDEKQEFPVHSNQLSEEITLPNAKGIYLLQLKTGNQVIIHKIVVK